MLNQIKNTALWAIAASAGFLIFDLLLLYCYTPLFISIYEKAYTMAPYILAASLIVYFYCWFKT